MGLVRRAGVIAAVAVVLMAGGCEGEAEQARPSSEGATIEAASSGQDPARFGEPLTGGTPVPLADLVADAAEYEGKVVRTEGVARRVCERKGCWMELAASAEESAPGCRVTFQDYGFFVPVDSAGAETRVQGRVEVRSVPEEVVAHMESEGGRFMDKTDDGTAREVRLVATGVEMELDG